MDCFADGPLVLYYGGPHAKTGLRPVCSGVGSVPVGCERGTAELRLVGVGLR